MAQLKDLLVTGTARFLNKVFASEFVGNLTGNVSGSSGSCTGNSATATKLTSSAGSATQPVYFSDGKPVATSYSLSKSVPSDAKFTDTTYSAATTSNAGLMSASDKTKLNGIAENANAYSHPASSGYKHIPSGGSSGQILKWSSDGTATWGSDKDTTYSNFVKSGSGAAAGLVPAPSTTAGTTKYLREDGTWQVPPDTNTTYSSKTAASGGTDVSLVTTGEKYTWNNKTSNTGTVTSIATSGAITGGTITTSGTISHSTDSGYKHIPSGGSSGQILRWSANGTAAWGADNNTTYSSKSAASGGTDVSLVTTGEKYIWNNKTSNTGTVTSIATSGAITGGTITKSGTISHSTSSGYKHIPSGGSSGQLLKWSADGTAAWGGDTGHADVTLNANGWSDTAPYTQTITVTGMTENWIPGIPILNPGSTIDVNDLLNKTKAMNCLNIITSSSNALTFVCCTNKPSVDISIRVPGMAERI